MSLFTHGYLFCSLGYNLILSFYFVAHIAPALAIMSYMHHYGFFVCSFFGFFSSISLLSATTWCSRLILNISCLVLESVIPSHGGLASFIQEWYSKPRSGYAHCDFSVIVFRLPWLTEWRHRCMYTNPYVYT